MHVCAYASVVLAAQASAVGTSAAAETTHTLGAVLATELPAAIASILPSTVTTTAPVTASAISAPFYLEVAATFFGALSGAIVGVRRRFDLVGVVVLAFVSGLGGGIVRDVLLQKYGIAAFQKPALIWTAGGAALLGALFYTAAAKARPLFLVFDALSLGLFAAIGADKGLRAALSIAPAILLGIITSVGGGIIRDIFVDTTPNVLRPGQLYATAALCGATVYVLLASWLNVTKSWALFVAIGVTFSLRMLGVWLGWRTALPPDLSGSVGSFFGQVGKAFSNSPAPIRVPAQAISQVAKSIAGWPAPPLTGEFPAVKPDDDVATKHGDGVSAGSEAKPSGSNGSDESG